MIFSKYLYKHQYISKSNDCKKEKRLNSAFNKNINDKVCNAVQKQITIKDFNNKILNQSKKNQLDCNFNGQRNVDPARVNFFSVAKEIINCHKEKSKGNDNLMRLLEQSVANRREIILEKMNVINYNSDMSPKNMQKTHQIMRRKLKQRINLNSTQITKFLDMLDFLKDSNMEIHQNLKDALKDLRTWLLQGKILKREQFQILDDIQIELIEKHLIGANVSQV